MIEHNLTLAWRQLVKYRLQSAVSVVSLAIGFACFALASMWIKYETTYDGFHRDADRMYFLATDHSQWGSEGDISISINSIFGDTVYKNCPEIVECTLFEHQYFLPKEGKGENYIACDSSFLDFFDINILVGDRGFLRRKDEIAITRQKAEEWWPGEDPLGKELEDKYGKRFVVTAIVEGWGAHTNLPFIFLSGETEARKTHYSGGEHVVRLAPQADVKSINERLDTLKINYYYWSKDGVRNHMGSDRGYELVPAKELRHRLNYKAMEVQINHIYLFAFAGGLLILCGLLNYLTMFINRLFIRQREIALRTVFGATGRNLTVQFLIEYGMVLLIAVYIGLIFMKWVLPDFRLLAGLPDGWGFFYRETFTSMFFVLAVSLLISLPVIQFFRQQALQNSIQPQVGLFSYSNFRKLSVCLQIGISIFFIFCTVVMMKQIHTLRHTDIGFNRENMGILGISTGNIMTDSDVEELDERMEAAYSYLRQQPELTEVIKNRPIFPLYGQTATVINKYSLLTGAAVNPDMVEDKYSFKLFTDKDGSFSSFYNLRLLEGRFFEESDDNNAIILNESATRQFLWESAVGKQILFSNEPYTIVGVVKDFHNYGPTTPAKPCFIRKNKDDGTISNSLIFKYHPGTWETLKEKFAQQFKEMDIKYTLKNVEAEYENLLRSEKNLQLLLSVTAGTCVLIALFGVWSMIMLTCEQRRKEIAIRKVHGATVKDILDMFFLEYMALQAVAAVVAFPIGYACMKPWLEQYVVQTEISWWIYVSIFLLVALLVALCIGWRVWKTATARPADEICKG